MNGPRLSGGFHDCLREFDSCSQGLAYLDHLYSVTLDALDSAEETWDAVEARAAAAAREDAPKAATATEVKGLITSYVNARPSDREAYDEAVRQRRNKAKIERWMRSLEKRLSAAQSALNGHESLARYGGGEK